MSFTWGTTTEEEANAAKPSIEYINGGYDFKVYASEDKVSPTSGNKYVLIKLKVFLPSAQVFSEDNIVDVPSMFFKRKHFWQSVGFPDKLNAPSEYYIGMEGKANFKVETYYSKKHAENRKKLVVVNYITSNNVLTEEDTYTKDNYTKDNSPSLEDYPAIEDDHIPF